MSVLTDLIARLLLPPALVVAVALIVRSHSAPGDGFSAGLVAAMAFLVMDVLQTEESHLPLLSPIAKPHWFGAIGLLPMLGVAFLPLVFGLSPLEHRPEGNAPSVGELHLDTAFLFDAGIAVLVIGVTLFAVRLFDPALEDARE